MKRSEERAEWGLPEEEEVEKTEMAQRDGLDGVLFAILVVNTSFWLWKRALTLQPQSNLFFGHHGSKNLSDLRWIRGSRKRFLGFLKS